MRLRKPPEECVLKYDRLLADNKFPMEISGPKNAKPNQKFARGWEQTQIAGIPNSIQQDEKISNKTLLTVPPHLLLTNIYLNFTTPSPPAISDSTSFILSEIPSFPPSHNCTFRSVGNAVTNFTAPASPPDRKVQLCRRTGRCSCEIGHRVADGPEGAVVVYPFCAAQKCC